MTELGVNFEICFHKKSVKLLLTFRIFLEKIIVEDKRVTKTGMRQRKNSQAGRENQLMARFKAESPRAIEVVKKSATTPVKMMIRLDRHIKRTYWLLVTL